MQRFHVHGLDFESEIEFPGLPIARGEPQARLEVRNVPDEIENVCSRGVLFQASERQFLLKFDPVGRFLVSDGNEILVEPSAGASESEIRHFLMGSPMGALLRQRGILALHASAVSTPLGAVLFAGLSAMGKSTLACAFHLKGYGLLSDEVSCACPDGDQYLLNPGPAEVLLWPDAIAKLGLPMSDLERVRKGVNKFRLSLPSCEPAAVPIRRVYILEPGSRELNISEVKGFEKVSALARHVYCVASSNGGASSIDQAFALARAVRVSLIQRPRNRFELEALVAAVEKDLET